jgi:hypothetical protein
VVHAKTLTLFELKHDGFRAVVYMTAFHLDLTWCGN